MSHTKKLSRLKNRSGPADGSVMKSVHCVELGTGSVTANLPPGFSYDYEDEGTVVAWLEKDPEALALRISCITLVPKDENVQPVTEVIADEAKAYGAQAVRTADKSYFVSEETSEENGEVFWLRFWQVGYRNYSFIISLCCVESCKRSPEVARVSRLVPEMISSLEQRPEHSELSARELQQLEAQREVVQELLRDRYDVFALPALRSDLPVLQQIIDDAAFEPDQVYEWSCVGIVFGGVLASELGLGWCAYSDEQGCEPALRLGDSSITLFPRSMILKRIEAGEEIDLDTFIENLADGIAHAKTEGC
jgi:hypothetical protein